MSGRGRPGPVGKGPRTQHTLRVPDPLYELLVEEWQASGYASLNDFVVAELAARRAATLAARRRADHLPISA